MAEKSFENPNWKPLDGMVGPSGCEEFMWMWREAEVEVYKHIRTRRYLLLDSAGHFYRRGPNGLEMADAQAEPRRAAERRARPPASVQRDVSDRRTLVGIGAPGLRPCTEVGMALGKKSRDEARQGLTLPRRALRKLAEVGIFAKAAVSLEHQHLAHRYVVRGTESGGAVEGFGHYVTFCEENGEPLAWLHPLDSVGVNGVHSLVIAPGLVRVEMFRQGHTYDLLITRHAPGAADNGKRPPLESKVLFRALEGYLALDLVKEHKDRRGTVMPTFYSRAGEYMDVPAEFESAIKAVAMGAACIGCHHSHYVCAPRATEDATAGCR